MARIQEAHEGRTLYGRRISQVPGVSGRPPEEFGHLDALIEGSSEMSGEWVRDGAVGGLQNRV